MKKHRFVGFLAVASLVAGGAWLLTSHRSGSTGSAEALPIGARQAALPDEEARELRSEKGRKEEGHAWEFFEWWYGTRAYPHDLIPKSAFYEAYRYAKENLEPQDALRDGGPQWTSIGPDNIGGRVLSLAIDPLNPDVVWAGAASGGLWKSTTGGVGTSAWTLIDTGYPTLSVSAIVVDPEDPDVVYIGTGEVSRYQRGQVGTPGARSSYGMGVLKTVDGGVTWQETGLTWTFDQSRGVFSLKMDPSNRNTLWAATSEGLYKSTDAGSTWSLAHDVLMAIDVVIDPFDSQKVWVSHGQLNSTPDPGIYRSTDGGASWTLLGGGLPTSDFGRTPLAIHRPTAISPTILWAGVSNASTRQVVGLFKSTNEGNTWARVNSTNWAGSQAWYDNSIGVNPHNGNQVFCGGLDWYRSMNGGSSLPQVSYWYLGYEGVVPPGGPEGPGNYVHADQHAVAFHPTNPNIVYVGSDGGVFRSTDGGVNWAGVNGGFVTTQIYNGFANGSVTTALALGGLQDNGTIKYLGTPSWSKVFGGDGGWCAIDPSNEQILYEEYVYLNMYKSTDGGNSWSEIHPGSSGETNFIAPFVLSESHPNVLYAGTRGIKKSTNGGASWNYPDGNSNWNGTPMASIAVAYTSPDTVVAATGSSSQTAVFEIRRSTNGGASWTNVTAGLPTRYPADITFDRRDSRNVWLVFSGYGTPHVYASTDAGLTWTDRSGNLPDIPVQCVAVDPIDSNWVYVGTDVGVYRTLDGGVTWMGMNAGMPPAMVLDLQIMPNERILRAATFGNGVYEMTLAAPAGVETAGSLAELSLEPPTPNPMRGETTIRFSTLPETKVEVAVFDVHGRKVRTLLSGDVTGTTEVAWDGRDDRGEDVAQGLYFVRVTGDRGSRTQRVAVLR